MTTNRKTLKLDELEIADAIRRYLEYVGAIGNAHVAVVVFGLDPETKDFEARVTFTEKNEGVAA